MARVISATVAIGKVRSSIGPVREAGAVICPFHYLKSLLQTMKRG
jgi:hypothetical protein